MLFVIDLLVVCCSFFIKRFNIELRKMLQSKAEKHSGLILNSQSKVQHNLRLILWVHFCFICKVKYLLGTCIFVLSRNCYHCLLHKVVFSCCTDRIISCYFSNRWNNVVSMSKRCVRLAHYSTYWIIKFTIFTLYTHYMKFFRMLPKPQVPFCVDPKIKSWTRRCSELHW